MKKLLLPLSIAILAFATSCSKDDDTNIDQPSKEKDYLDATSYTTWHYISAKDNSVVGTGEHKIDDAKWAARTDWDFAIQRFKVRTNSGTSSSVDANGGVHTFGKDVAYADISSISTAAPFVADVDVTEEQMDESVKTESKSTAVVSVMASGMPPTWLKAPIYAIRSADGKSVYKVEFTQYKNEKGESGCVKYNIAGITKKSVYVDATSSTLWHYYSTKTGTVIGTGTDVDGVDVKWAARKDWDFAINSYNIRTNGGTSSTNGAQAGVFIFADKIEFGNVNKTSISGVEYLLDATISTPQMGGAPKLVSKSKAVVSKLQMPPVNGVMWSESPVYAFRSADGTQVWKVKFESFATTEMGKVYFNIAEVK